MLGEGPINTVASSQNFTELLTDYHTSIYLSFGAQYTSRTVEYSLAEHTHLHKESTGKLLIVQQCDISQSNATADGFGYINSRYSYIKYQQYSVRNNTVVATTEIHRVDLYLQKGGKGGTYLIVLGVALLLSAAGFLHAYVARRLSQKKHANLKPVKELS